MQNSSRADCSHGTPRFAELSGSTALPEDGKRVEKKRQSDCKCCLFLLALGLLRRSLGKTIRLCRVLRAFDSRLQGLYFGFLWLLPNLRIDLARSTGKNSSFTGNLPTSPGSSSLSPGSIPPAGRCSRQQHGKESSGKQHFSFS